jgi:hypothetical protein
MARSANGATISIRRKPELLRDRNEGVASEILTACSYGRSMPFDDGKAKGISAK